MAHFIPSSLAAAALLATAALVMPSCDKKPQSTASSGIATIACDASFENIMQQEIDVFEFNYKDASIIPYYIDEKACLDSILDLSTKLAVTTRELTADETAYLKSHDRQVRQSRIAVDAIALIVNPANKIDQISVPELVDILSGKEQTWEDIWPNDGLDSIRVVFDHQGSSTVQYVRDSLLNGAPLGPNVFAQKSPQEVFKAVASNKNAIGVIGVSWISTDMATSDMSTEERTAFLNNDSVTYELQQVFNTDVKVLKVSAPDEVEAFAPFQYYIYTGQYPLTRSIYMICTAAGGTISHGFYTYVTSFYGQKLIQSTGVLPNIMYTKRVELVNR
ncbi:MAG: substrate-binding domain-containing protein [Pseudoflavonifractor sp.]|nr:substrate-binding domain-containing protein [Alloprevotella sp.]MCM1117561.1 substrate-binding domain-containing protein [Pseudoflavonifractor sp.]